MGDDDGDGERPGGVGRSIRLMALAGIVVAVLVVGIAQLVQGGDGAPTDGSWAATGTAQGAGGEATFSLRIDLAGDDLVEGDVVVTWDADRSCDGAWRAAPAPGEAEVSGGHVVLSTVGLVEEPCDEGDGTVVLIGDVDGDVLVAELELRRGATVVASLPVRLTRQP